MVIETHKRVAYLVKDSLEATQIAFNVANVDAQTVGVAVGLEGIVDAEVVILIYLVEDIGLVFTGVWDLSVWC